MKTHFVPYLILPIALLFAFMNGSATAVAADADAQQIADITDSAKAFVDAFHKGDAKAVAAFWMPDGDYVDEHGRILKGRKAIVHHGDADDGLQ
jgi:hypothetical protein